LNKLPLLQSILLKNFRLIRRVWTELQHIFPVLLANSPGVTVSTSHLKLRLQNSM